MSTYDQVREIKRIVDGTAGVGVAVSNPAAESSLATIATNTAVHLGAGGVDLNRGLLPGPNNFAEPKAAFLEFTAGSPQTVGSGFDNSGTIITFDVTRMGVPASIASTSATDMYDEASPFLSTGAHTCLVTYVDGNGDKVVVLQRLNGTTEQPITVDGTLTGTPASVIAVNNMLVLPNFAGGDIPTAINDGDLFVGPASADWTTTPGNPTVKFHAIKAGDGISNIMFIYAYNGVQIFLPTIAFVGDNDSAKVTTVSAHRDLGFGVPYKVFEFLVLNQVTIPLPTIPPLTSGQVLWFQCNAPTPGTHKLSGFMNCLFFDLP